MRIHCRQQPRREGPVTHRIFRLYPTPAPSANTRLPPSKKAKSAVRKIICNVSPLQRTTVMYSNCWSGPFVPANLSANQVPLDTGHAARKICVPYRATPGTPALPCISEVHHVPMATFVLYCRTRLRLPWPLPLRIAPHLARIHLRGGPRRRQRRPRTHARLRPRSPGDSFRGLSL
jgi:hypothetical protein